MPQRNVFDHRIQNAEQDHEDGADHENRLNPSQQEDPTLAYIVASSAEPFSYLLKVASSWYAIAAAATDGERCHRLFRNIRRTTLAKS
jgi:hypothetical protein